MTNWTPGPWATERTAGGAWIISAAGQPGLAYAADSAAITGLSAYPAAANAHLIAAAPDLFEALAGLLTITPGDDRYALRMEAAFAALAKARGETP